MLYQLIVFIPESHLEPVKQAMFAAGGGKIGDYDCCAWQCQGSGQFRPLAGAKPFIGETGKIETVSEYRVELVCSAEAIKPTLEALKKSHPYETPAYFVVELKHL